MDVPYGNHSPIIYTKNLIEIENNFAYNYNTCKYIVGN